MEIFKKGYYKIFSNSLSLEDSFLFNTYEYYELHSSSNTDYFKLSFKENLVATICVKQEDNNIWKSPIRGTFGGFEFVNNVSPQIIHDSILFFEEFAKSKRKIDAINFTLPPIFYNSAQSTLVNILLRLNYKIINNELNHYSVLNKSPLRSEMNKTFKKKLNRLLKNDLEFSISSNITESYDLLKINRENRGVKISMSLEKLVEMKKKLNENVLFFDLKSELGLLASSVCISINKSVLYVLYWGHNKEYDHLSPVILLANKIHEFSQNNGYEIMDIGTSSLNGKIDEGLKKFKDSLGFENGLKFTFEKYI